MFAIVRSVASSAAPSFSASKMTSAPAPRNSFASERTTSAASLRPARSPATATGPGRQATSTALFEHLGVYRVLLGSNHASHHWGFAEEMLGCLQQHDAQAGSELVATLRCWVAADYSVAQAARRLYVHPNTVKYRLRRIRELIGGDPSRGDLRLQIELALKILDLPQLGLDERP